MTIPNDSMPAPGTNPSSARADGEANGELGDLADWTQEHLPEAHERISDGRASFMFKVAVGFLFIIGLMAGHSISGEATEIMFGWWLGIPLLVLWAIVILEGLWGMATTRDHHWGSFLRFSLVVLCPPFRAAFSPAHAPRFVCLPKNHWLAVSKLNFERVELRVALPMLGVTLLVLPLLGIELFFGAWLVEHLWASIVVHCLTAVIWFAFALEFILMLALSEKKLVYCKTHWINIAIIVLPLIAFLRALRLFRFLRLAKASRILRAYRMRGVFARAMRLAMVFNLIERLLERKPEKYLLALEEKVREKEAEICALEEKMADLRAKIAEEERDENGSADSAPASRDASRARSLS